MKNSLAKMNMTQAIASDMPLTIQEAKTKMEAIQSKQELARYRALRESYIAEGTVAAEIKLLELDAKMSSPEIGLVDPEIVKAQQGIDLAKMKAGRADGIKSAVLQQAQLFRDEKTGKIDIKAGQDFIKKSGLPAEDQLDVLKDLNTWNAQEQQALEQQRGVDRNTINNQLYKELDFEKAIATIDGSSLDEKEQGRKMKEARELQLLWAKGGRDAKQEKEKSDLLIKISQNPRKYNESYISDEALVGKIHPSHLPQLKLWRDKVVKGLIGTVAAKKGYDLLKIYNTRGVFGTGTEGANLYIEMVDNFTEFLLEKDRTAKEVTEYIGNMTPELGAWARFWSGFNAGERRERAKRIRKLADVETERLEETKLKTPEITIDPTKEPKTEDEFIKTANSISDATNKRLYVDKWLEKF